MSSVSQTEGIRNAEGSWPLPVNESLLAKSRSFVLPALVALFVVARLWHVTATPLSFDEIFSIDAIRHTWAGLFDFVRRDLVHPPLFYVLLKVWVRIGGESNLWLRLFSTIIAIVSIFPLLLLFKELQLGTRERNLSLLIISLNGFLIYYSQLLRMYSLLLFLSLCSLCVVARIVKGGSKRSLLWLLFGINLLLVYTHYFGWFLMGAELIAIAVWRREYVVHFFGTVVLVAIGFSPWIYAVAQVYGNRGLSHNIGWISRPHLASIIAFYATLNDKPFEFPSNGKIALLIFAAPILVFGLRSLARSLNLNASAQVFWFLFIFSFAPVLAVYVASLLFGQSIWLPRGLLFVAAPYLMLVIVAASGLRPRWVGNVMLVLVVAWAVLSGFKNVTRAAEGNGIDSWAHEMIQMESDKSTVKLYALDEHTPYMLWFYLRSEHAKQFEITLVKSPKAHRSEDYWLTGEMFPSITVNDLTQLDGDHFWVAFTTAQWKVKRTPQEIFTQAGYRIGKGFEGGKPDDKTYLFPVWR